MKTIILTLSILFMLVGISRADEHYSTDAIVEAIWYTEGGLKADYPFGIRSINCRGYEECKQICYNTVENNKTRYKMQGHKQEKDFLTFLAKRYCPNNWEIWLKNVKYFLGKNH